mgnify:CR=1 FL=1
MKYNDFCKIELQKDKRIKHIKAQVQSILSSNNCTHQEYVDTVKYLNDIFYDNHTILFSIPKKKVIKTPLLIVLEVLLGHWF